LNAGKPVDILPAYCPGIACGLPGDTLQDGGQAVSRGLAGDFQGTPRQFACNSTAMCRVILSPITYFYSLENRQRTPTYIVMLHIPEDYTEFFHWVKERTETFWSKDPSQSTDDFTCEEWAYGAKWVPLNDAQIDAVEKKYDVQFMPEHRAFLKILHTIDRKEVIVHEPYDEGDEPAIVKTPFFYNWLEDEEEIRERLDWPVKTIYQDIQGPNGVWLRSWGKRPASDEERQLIFTDWLMNAPRLVPLTSHRFLVSELDLTDRPVLSVYGSDIIVYGWDIRLYLLNELKSELDLLEAVYDEEDECYYSQECEALKVTLDAAYASAPQKDIPYWKEMILFWSSGWSGFGMRSPTGNGETVQPIRKTYIPEDGEDDQKQFMNF
jgi:hypothetical protein